MDSKHIRAGGVVEAWEPVWTALPRCASCGERVRPADGWAPGTPFCPDCAQSARSRLGAAEDDPYVELGGGD